MNPEFHLQLNPFAISNLIIILTNFPLFLLILKKGKSLLSLIFSLHILSVLVWGIGGFLISITHQEEVSSLLWKIAYADVLLIPVFFQHAVLLITKNYNKYYLYFVYLQAILFIPAVIFNKIFISFKLISNSFYFFQGNLLYLFTFIIWVTIVLIAHYQLIDHYRKCYPKQKRQILVLIFAIIGFSGGITNFLAGFDIDIYPYGNLLIPIHSICITYAILKYQLLEIQVVIRKGLVYSILIAILTLSYLSIVIILEKLIQQTLGYHSTVVSVFTAFSVGLLFIPLRNKIQYFVDRIIFKGTPEEMAFQVEKFKDIASEADQYKTMATFATGVAHEIRNPLAAINTFCEYLPEKIHDKEFLKNFAQVVGDQVKRMNDFLTQLGEYGKPSPLKIKPTDIHKVLRDTLALFNSQCLDQKIQVREIFEHQKITLMIDSAKIQQTLINIIKNAIEAMPRGGMLTVKTQENGFKNFSITISDTGRGIPNDALPHIFDPFFTSQKDQGTGLGLSITQAIIEEHGGNIRAESQLAVGTNIIIELPLLPK